MAFETIMKKLKSDMNKTPMSPSAAGWIFGTVTSVDPLEIKIESGLTLPAEVLALSPFASVWEINTTDNEKDDGYFNFKHHHKIKKQKTEMQVVTGLVASPTISGSATVTDPVMHYHDIHDQETEDAIYSVRMWRGLEKEDTVLLSRVQGGQQYVVWFRVSFLDNSKTDPDTPPVVEPPSPAVKGVVPSVDESATVAVTCTALVTMLPPPASVAFSGVHYSVDTGEADDVACSGTLLLGVGVVILEPGYWTFSCEYEGTKYSSDMIFVPFGGTSEATLS